jgi:hypothetical protein
MQSPNTYEGENMSKRHYAFPALAVAVALAVSACDLREEEGYARTQPADNELASGDAETAEARDSLAGVEADRLGEQNGSGPPNFAELDGNDDGRISREEATAVPDLEAHFDQLDANNDDELTLPEYRVEEPVSSEDPPRTDS